MNIYVEFDNKAYDKDFYYFRQYFRF